MTVPIPHSVVASLTDTGTGDASTYGLELVVAAALLVPQPAGRTR